MSMEIKPDSPEELRASQEAGYEKRDVNVPALLKFGFWMALLLFVTFLGMRWTFWLLQPDADARGADVASIFAREQAGTAAKPAAAGNAARGFEGLLPGCRNKK